MRKFCFTRAWALVLVMALIAAVVGCAPEKEPGGEITLGVIKALGTVSPYVAQAQGYFEEEGVEVRLVEFPDGPSMMEAFASGSLDVAIGGLAPAAIWRSRGIDIRIVAAANSGGHLILTREELGLTDISDLEGRRVATPRTGSVTDTLFRAYALTTLAGLDPDRDLKISPGMAPDAMPAALFLTREIDACVTWEPFAAQALSQFQGAQVLFNFNSEWKKSHGSSYPVNVVSATAEMIGPRRDDLRALLIAHRRTQDFIESELATANEIIARELTLDPSVIGSARQNVEFTFSVDPDQAMVILKMVRSLGYVEQLPEPGDLFFLQLQEEISSP